MFHSTCSKLPWARRCASPPPGSAGGLGALGSPEVQTSPGRLQAPQSPGAEFRPGRSCHQALDALWRAIMSMGGYWLIDADVSKLLGTLDKGHLRTMLDRRVRDGVIRRDGVHAVHGATRPVT